MSKPDEQTPAAGGPGPLPEPKTMTYQDLRRMAEAASSLRGREFWLVIDHGGWTLHTQPPERTPGRVVIPCGNPPSARRPSVRLARLGSGEGRPMDLLRLNVGGRVEAADAVFWSASAVEKFVVPYYASVGGSEADARVAEVLSVLGRDGSGPDGATAFGLAHLPKSEYVQVGGTEEDRFAVLVSHATEGSSAVPLSEYVAAGRPSRA